MPRRLRFLPAGSVNHVINRGNDRRVLFETPRDYEQFLQLMVLAKRRANIRIPAYVLVPNHWHFVLWPSEDGQVEEFQHHLTTTHALRRRRLTCTVGQGHIYQDRYHAFSIWTETQYVNVVRYVEANPLRACLVKNAAHWRWSSLYERLGHPRGIVDEGPVALPDDWPAIVNASMTQETVDEIRKSLRKH